MKSKIFYFNLIFIFNFCLNPIFSENNFKSSIFYLELFGQSIFISVNAEYRFLPNFTFRIGASYFLLGIGCPIAIYYLSGGEFPHHIELGFGASYIESGSLIGSGGSQVSLIFTPSLGYRYLSKDGGFVFRINYSPILNPIMNKYEFLWGGISVGLCF